MSVAKPSPLSVAKPSPLSVAKPSPLSVAKPSPLSSICNQIYNQISEKDYGNYDDTDIGKTTSSILLFKSRPRFDEHLDAWVIERMGDLLVGFYAEKDCKFDLVISNEKLCSFEMKAGDFSYAIQGKYVLPIIKLQFNLSKLIKLDNTNYPLLVYAQISDNDVRRTIVNNNYQFDMVTDDEQLETYVITEQGIRKIKMLLKPLPNMLDYTET